MIKLTGKTKSMMPWVIFCLAVYFLYLHTLCSTFNINDSGETIAVSYLLDIGHAPGYPLHTIAGRLFCLLPFGTPAYRVTLLSAILSALTVLLLAWFFYLLYTDIRWHGQTGEQEGKPVQSRVLLLAWSFASALMLALSETFWFQAGGAKGGIYALNSFFLSAMMLCLYGWWRNCTTSSLEGDNPSRVANKERYLALFFFILGLATSHHWQSLTFVPAYLVFLWPRYFRAAVQRPGIFARHVALFALGCTPLLYLPLRAQHKLPLNLGEPNTWSNFLWVIKREGFWKVGAEHGLELWQRNVRRFLEVFYEQFQDPGHYPLLSGLVFALLLATAIGGLYWLVRHRRTIALFSFILSLLLLGGVILYANPVESHEWSLDNFFTVFYFMLVIWIGCGAFCLQRFLRRHRYRAHGLVPVVLLAIFLLTACSNYPVANGRKYYFGYDYGMNLLKSTPQGAILFCAGDIDVLPLWYLRYVQGERPDVAVVTVQLLTYPWYRRNLARQYPFLETRLRGRTRMKTATTTIIRNNLGHRPICYSFIYLRPWLTDYPSLPHGTVNRLVSDEEQQAGPDLALNERLWSAFFLRGVFSDRSYVDDYTQRLIDSYGLPNENLGVTLAGVQRYGEALRYLSRAADFYYSASTKGAIYLNMVRCCENLHNESGVIEYLRKCLEFTPHDFAARVKLGNYYVRIGKSREALVEYRLAQQIKPGHPGVAQVVSSLEQGLEGANILER